MVECDPFPRQPPMVLPQLWLTACLETVVRAVGQDMGRECLPWEEWCKMLDTNDLCILAM